MKLRTSLLTLLILLTALTGACNGCSSAVEVDEDPQVRVTELAELVPKHADAAVVIPDIQRMPDTMEYLLARHRHVDPGPQDLATRVSQQLEVQITSMEMLELAGFHPEGSVMVSMVEGRPVLTAHVADENAFVRYFVGPVRTAENTETRITDEEIGGREFSVSGDSRFDDMAWYFEEGKVVLVMAPYPMIRDFVSNSAEDVAATLAEMDGDATLADSDAFAVFRDQVGDDHPLSLYLSRAGLGEEDGQAIADTMGLGFRAEPARIEMNLFVDDADVDHDQLLDDEVLAGFVSTLGLDGEELVALGEHLDRHADDHTLRFDFSTVRDDVHDISALEDLIALVRAVEDLEITTDAGDDGVHFHFTVEFTETLSPG